MLDALKRLNLNTITLEEALHLHAVAKQLRAEHEAFMVDVPEWLSDTIRQLNGYIASQRRDALELRLKQLQDQEEALKTPTERREAVRREREAIEQRLGVGAAGAGVSSGA